MEEKDLKQVTTEIIETAATKAAEKVETTMKQDLETVKQTAETLKQTTDELKANYNGINEIVSAMGPVTHGKKEMNTKEVIEQKFAEKGGELKEGDRIQLELKTAMLTTTAVTDRTWNYQLSGISRGKLPAFSFTDFFPTIQVTDPNSFAELSYADWDNNSISRAAAMRAENGAISESDLVLIEKVVRLQSVGDSLTISKAALKNAKMFANEIEFFLNDNINRVLNTQMYSGNNTPPNLNGLYTQAPAFNYAGYTGVKFIQPNIADLALVMATTIRNAAERSYTPDFAFVSWNNYLQLLALKNTNADYILAPLNGIQFIPSSFVTNNTMVVGCSNLVRIYTNGMVDIEVGYKSGNFEKRLPTILVETMAQLLIREADKYGFLKVDNITNALAAIEEAS